MPHPQDPWAGCRFEREAREVPDLCDHCGEETDCAEEVTNGDLLCQECATKYHKKSNRNTRGGK